MISIIIPSYNHGNNVESLLKSIFAQSYENYQIIIIDGGSTDSTNSVIQKFLSSIYYYNSEKDNGIFEAMNKGIAKATGDWLYFIGCDDCMYNKDVLSAIFATRQYTNEKVIAGKIFNLKLNKILGQAITAKADLLHQQIWHQSVFYHRDVFSSAGIYATKYTVSSDSIFNRMLFCNYDFKWIFLDVIVAKYSGTGASSLVFDREYHNDQKTLYFEWFNDVPRSAVYDGLQYHMYNEFRHGNILAGAKEIISIIWHTKSLSPYIYNALFWFKERISEKFRA